MARYGKQVLPNLTYLPNGEVVELDGGIRVGGIGGCFGSSNYERKSDELKGYAKRHFTRDEIEKLSGSGKLDILLLHDAPRGFEFVKHFRDNQERRYQSTALGLAEVVSQTMPRICFFGHHHVRTTAEVNGIKCFGLNNVGYPGNLISIEMKSSVEGYIKLGEWPVK